MSSADGERPLRVAVINSLRVRGGGEKWVARQTARWREAGLRPRVFCPPGSGLAELMRETGVETVPVVMRHDLSPTAVLALARELRRFRPHALLCCNERAFRLGAPASLLAGAPPLVYRNGLTGTFKNRAHNRLFRRRLARMVVNSEALRQEMAAFGWIPPDRLRVIRNGVDLAAFAPDPPARERLRRELGTPEGAVVAAVLARLTEDKGLVETIQALAALRERCPGAEFWIAGEGSLGPRLAALARELGVAERVRFLGFRQDVPAVLQGADLVIQASHREGLGNTLLEAMASARPVIASTVGGNVDVVVPGETGALVPPRDPQALADALAPYLTDPDLRRRSGEAGLRRAREHFSLERETGEWLALLNEATR